MKIRVICKVVKFGESRLIIELPKSVRNNFQVGEEVVIMKQDKREELRVR